VKKSGVFWFKKLDQELRNLFRFLNLKVVNPVRESNNPGLGKEFLEKRNVFSTSFLKSDVSP